ncbi:hypothetical protein GOBAR_DD04464 [Gossypium barbadense]|nr:hypothetical protein GOBAR_DD04464 [Gossypium barbadense]
MDDKFFVCVYFDGVILTTSVGCIFECRQQIAMRFNRNDHKLSERGQRCVVENMSSSDCICLLRYILQVGYLDAKNGSRACTYLGYIPNHNYLIKLAMFVNLIQLFLGLELAPIFVSRHVIFDEAFYLFAKTETSSTKTGLSIIHQQSSVPLLHKTPNEWSSGMSATYSSSSGDAGVSATGSSGSSASIHLSGAGDALNARVSTPIDQPIFLVTPSPVNQSSGSLEESYKASLSSSDSVSTSVPMDQLGIAPASLVAPVRMDIWEPLIGKKKIKKKGDEFLLGVF